MFKELRDMDEERDDPLHTAVQMFRIAKALEGGGDKDVLDIEYKQLRNLQARRKLTEPLAQEKIQREEIISSFKRTVDSARELVAKEMDPAARENMKAWLVSYVGQFPQNMRQEIGPILAYSPADPVKRDMDKFDQIYPAPKKPWNPVQDASGGWSNPETITQDNERQWAEYFINSAEHGMLRKRFQDKLVGVQRTDAEYQPPLLYQGLGENLWFKDKATGQVSMVNSKYMPQAELKAAIEKYNWSYADFLHLGSYPMEDWRDVHVGESVYSVRKMRNIMTGEIIIDKQQIAGESSGKTKKMNEHLATGLAAANMNMSPSGSALKNQPQAALIVSKLKEIKDIIEAKGLHVTDKEGKKSLHPEVAAVMKPFNDYLAKTYGYTIAATHQLNTAMLKALPFFDSFRMDNGYWVALPFDQVASYTLSDGRQGSFYYNNAIKAAFDATGQIVEGTKDKPPGAPGETIPVTVKAEGQKKEASTEPEKTDQTRFVKGAIETINKLPGALFKGKGTGGLESSGKTLFGGTSIVPLRQFIKRYNEVGMQKSKEITQWLEELDSSAQEAMNNFTADRVDAFKENIGNLAEILTRGQAFIQWEAKHTLDKDDKSKYGSMLKEIKDLLALYLPPETDEEEE